MATTNYSMIHAITAKEMFATFNTSRLRMTQKECHEYYRVMPKKEAATRLWVKALEMVVEDIIENGTQFQLPTTRRGTGYLYLQRIQGDEFVKLKNRGALKGFDPVETMFNGYYLSFCQQRPNGRETSQVIHLNKKHTDVIARKASTGKIKAGRVKDYTDFIDVVKEKFPGIPREDISLILYHGFRTMFSYLSRRCDILVKNNDMVFYCGKIYCNITRKKAYIVKKAIYKIRIMEKLLKLPQDDYVYFFYKNPFWLPIKNSFERGEAIHFGKIALYRIFDECMLTALEDAAIFRIKKPFNFTPHKVFYDLTTDKAELVEELPKWSWNTFNPKVHKMQALISYRRDFQSIYNERNKLDKTNT